MAYSTPPSTARPGCRICSPAIYGVSISVSVSLLDLTEDLQALVVSHLDSRELAALRLSCHAGLRMVFKATSLSLHCDLGRLTAPADLSIPPCPQEMETMAETTAHRFFAPFISLTSLALLPKLTHGSANTERVWQFAHSATAVLGPTLRAFSLGRCAITPRNFLSKLVNNAPHLTNLTLSGMSDTRTMPEELAPLTKLKNLSVLALPIAVPTAFPASLLTQLSCLVSLKLWCLTWNDESSAALEALSHSLECLVVDKLVCRTGPQSIHPIQQQQQAINHNLNAAVHAHALDPAPQLPPPSSLHPPPASLQDRPLPPICSMRLRVLDVGLLVPAGGAAMQIVEQMARCSECSLSELRLVARARAQVMAVLDLQSSPYLAQRVTHLAWRSGCRELCAVLADLVQQEQQLWGHYDDGAGDHTVDGGISSVGGMSQQQRQQQQQQQFPASQPCRSLEAAAASHSHSRDSHSFQPATACGASATANDSSSSSTAVPKAAPVAATLVPLPLGNLVSLSLEMWQHAPQLGELDEAAPWVFGHTFSTECTALCRQDTGHISTVLAGDTNGVSTNARGASWSHRESPNEGMAVHRAQQLAEQAHAVYDPWVTLRMQKPLQHLRLAAWSAALHAKDCAIQHEINPSVQTNVARTKRLLACIPKVDLVMYNMCVACVRELFDGSRSSSSSSSSPGSTSHASIIRQCSRCTWPEPPRLSEGSLHSHVHVQPQRWLAPKPPLVSLHLGGSYEQLPGLLAALAGWETLEAVRLIPYYTQGAPTLGAVSRCMPGLRRMVHACMQPRCTTHITSSTSNTALCASAATAPHASTGSVLVQAQLPIWQPPAHTLHHLACMPRLKKLYIRQQRMSNADPTDTREWFQSFAKAVAKLGSNTSVEKPHPHVWPVAPRVALSMQWSHLEERDVAPLLQALNSVVWASECRDADGAMVCSRRSTKKAHAFSALLSKLSSTPGAASTTSPTSTSYTNTSSSQPRDAGASGRCTKVQEAARLAAVAARFGLVPAAGCTAAKHATAAHGAAHESCHAQDTMTHGSRSIVVVEDGQDESVLAAFGLGPSAGGRGLVDWRHQRQAIMAAPLYGQ